MEQSQLRTEIAECEKLLIGIGGEWQAKKAPDVLEAYAALAKLIDGKDYFIVTDNTDAAIFESALDPERMVAPCGNDTWRQCRDACTKDIWEPGEVPDGICPHCGAPLISNTVEAGTYIEEGYLPRWNEYKLWLARTLNKRLLILELGVDFRYPTVIRWPFEKTAFVNEKAKLYRVNGSFSQISEELRGKAEPVAANSVEFIRGLC